MTRYWIYRGGAYKGAAHLSAISVKIMTGLGYVLVEVSGSVGGPDNRTVDRSYDRRLNEYRA